MKVWISKYALTQGIFETEAEICETFADMIKCVGEWGAFYHGEGKEWHKTKEEAIVKAEEMRLKKIESLKKQIDKLTKMKFE